MLWRPRHPETLHAMLSLAKTYYMMQRRDEALEMAQTAGDIVLQSLGMAHPLYNETSAFLAMCTGP
jgi:3-deoxy-D-manno-octulosonic-acid transferase